MNWDTILQLRTWSPLSSLEHLLIESRNGFLEIGVNAYVIAQPYDRNFEINKPGAPFVTLAYWTESVTAMERLVLGEPTREHGGHRGTPPEILLLQTNGTFGELKSAGKQRQIEVSERGLYSPQGEFLHRTLDVGRFSYCFYGREDVHDERPFAIQVSLHS